MLGARGGLEDFITAGLSEAERAAIGHLPVGMGILGALITDAAPLRLRRIADDSRSVGFPPEHPPMSSFLGVPITVRGRVYGNLYLTEKRGAAEFTEADERAVVTLAARRAWPLRTLDFSRTQSTVWRSRSGSGWRGISMIRSLKLFSR